MRARSPSPSPFRRDCPRGPGRRSGSRARRSRGRPRRRANPGKLPREGSWLLRRPHRVSKELPALGGPRGRPRLCACRAVARRVGGDSCPPCACVRDGGAPQSARRCLRRPSRSEPRIPLAPPSSPELKPDRCSPQVDPLCSREAHCGAGSLVPHVSDLLDEGSFCPTLTPTPLTFSIFLQGVFLRANFRFGGVQGWPV